MKINNIQEHYIDKFRNIFGDRYDYTNTKIIKSNQKVEIGCKSHGSFFVTPNNHLNKKSGCPKCKNVDKNFIESCNVVHDYRYDYTLVEYVNNRSEIKIKCPAHGIFIQTAMHHKSGSICPECNIEKMRYSIPKLIEEGNQIFDNKYDYKYLEEDYVGSGTNVRIICPLHGVFKQNIHSHFKRKYGCLKCKPVSKAVLEIEKLLDENEIIFEREKTFEGCKNISLLYFDLYLPKYNICIEYNGRQHYEAVSYFGGEEQLIKQQINDNIKIDFCKDKMELIIISYIDDVNLKIKELCKKLSINLMK